MAKASYNLEWIKEMYQSGMAVKDIADVVGCSISTVRRIVAFAGLVPDKEWQDGTLTVSWQHWFSCEWTKITDFLKERLGKKDEPTGTEGTEETEGEGTCLRTQIFKDDRRAAGAH